METTERHLRLLTETSAAVNSTLDLEEVLHLVAEKVAAALEADACFVYLYDEAAGELVLRATRGTPLDEMMRRPRLRVGEGITGTAAAERRPVAIAAEAHLDPRWKEFPNLPESEYESILAVPIVARDQLAGALNVRTRAPREFRQDEVALLEAIASQVAQSIVHAKLYADAQRRVLELEALAKISEAVSESLYLEESLEAIVKTTMDAVQATGAALVLEDGRIAWPEGRPGKHAVRTKLRWKRREIGELVADRDTPFTDEERALLEAIAHHAAVALEHGRAVMRGVSRKRSTTASRTTSRPSPRSSACRRTRRESTRARRSSTPSTGSSPSPRCTRRSPSSARRTSSSRSSSTACARCSCRGSAADATSKRASSRSRLQATARPRSRSSSASCSRTRSSTAPAASRSSSRSATATRARDRRRGGGTDGARDGTGL